MYLSCIPLNLFKLCLDPVIVANNSLAVSLLLFINPLVNGNSSVTASIDANAIDFATRLVQSKIVSFLRESVLDILVLSENDPNSI